MNAPRLRRSSLYCRPRASFSALKDLPFRSRLDRINLDFTADPMPHFKRKRRSPKFDDRWFLGFNLRQFSMAVN